MFTEFIFSTEPKKKSWTYLHTKRNTTDVAAPVSSLGEQRGTE